MFISKVRTDAITGVELNRKAATQGITSYRPPRVKDLSKVPTCTRRLEWSSNLRSSGRKAPNLPQSHPRHMQMTRSITRNIFRGLI